MSEELEYDLPEGMEPIGFTPDGKPIIFRPQPGAQRRFLRAEVIYELLFHGTRGNGKTAAMIMAFTRNVGVGYGMAWRGIIFRQSYAELADIVKKTHEWFLPVYGNSVTFHKGDFIWTWDTGETLKLDYMERPEHYNRHHGGEYTFIGWEELTNWATPEMYLKMMSTLRTARKGVPLMCRSTTNPSGVGHNWVKRRFNLANGEWRRDKMWLRPDGRTIGRIHGHYLENKLLLAASPGYIEGVINDAHDEYTRKAWAEGSWDITSGGMFDDVWKPEHNIVRPFAIPRSWTITRSFDWGASSPFSVGWYAISDGSDVVIDGKVHSTVSGDIFRIAEWYGWNGKDNEGLDLVATDIAKGIVEREVQMNLRTPHESLVTPGPADNQIFGKGNASLNIARDMQKTVRADTNVLYPGVEWLRSDKRSGTRVGGWQKIRELMKNAHPRADGRPREKPGFFIWADKNPQWERCVPALARDTKGNVEDIAKNQEDHIADETRYMCLHHAAMGFSKAVKVVGTY